MVFSLPNSPNSNMQADVFFFFFQWPITLSVGGTAQVLGGIVFTRLLMATETYCQGEFKVSVSRFKP